MTVVERFYAVLCEYAVPSTSMAHAEEWVGPFDNYEGADAFARKAVDNGHATSAHVCKRIALDREVAP